MAQSGYTPLSLYYSATASTAPLAANLVAGELALNTNDGKLYYKDSSGVVQVLATKASSSGSFGALTATSITDSGLTSGRVTYATTGGLLTDSANMTFNGTTFTTANDASISGLTVGKGGGSQGDNTVVGTGTALGANTSGVYNSAFGSQALKANTTGNNNTGLGWAALYANTTGGSNTAIGPSALQNNTTASNNTAVGYQAGYTNQTGNYNTFTGYQAGYTSNVNGNAANAAYGWAAGYFLTTGTSNTLLGASAGYYVSSGSKNTILGGYNGNQGGLDIRTASNYIVLSDGDGNPRQVIDSSGNVGIGTGSPNEKVTIASSGAASYIQICDSSTGTTSSDGLFLGSFNGAAELKTKENLQLAFGTNNTERMRIDSSGNVGIGTSNPSAFAKTAVVGSVGSNTLYVGSSTQGVYISNSTGNDVVYNASGSNAGSHVWQTGNTERMRIDTSGNLLINNTTANSAPASGFCFNAPTTASYGAIGHANGSASGTGYYYFSYNGGFIGSITQNGTTAVLYNTTSDYRLKEDVTPITNALATVEALNPVSFTWVDGREDNGFLAHELQAVIPNCVTGEKDAINEDGTPHYQQMDNSGVIPFLVKAIQELNAEVQALKQQLGK